MTWKQIKEKIESLGIQDSDLISNIDLTNLDEIEDIFEGEQSVDGSWEVFD